MADINDERSVRRLSALEKTASTSRVLNLLAVSRQHKHEVEYLTQPFFRCPILNESIILKHRVRPDEQYVFSSPTNIATKVILPFERSDLGIGGQSFFVGQKGWMTLVQDLAGADGRIQTDLAVFQAMEGLPSLDPFLLREQLNRHGFNVARQYFSISDADMKRMQAFVGQQIGAVIEMAFPSGTDIGAEKLAALLLSSQLDDRVAPLRTVLRLEEEAYREGMFSWKGFLYYQWALADIDPRLAAMLKDLPRLTAPGSRDSRDAVYVRDAKIRIVKAVRDRRREINIALEVYHAAYRDLTQNGKPMAFRDFLVKAPAMFMALGEKIGAISHVASFWQYRFSKALELTAHTDELLDILQDFESALYSQITSH